MGSGTASTIETKQFAELVAAVVRQLPRDIDPSAAQHWIEDQGSLQSALRGALMPTNGSVIPAPVKQAAPSPAIASYSICVDYGQTLKVMIKAGQYNWVNDDITHKQFPHDTSQGTEEVAIEVVHFNRYIEIRAVVTELEAMGMRPATIEELLALGAKFPDLQWEYPIVALGSVWAAPSGIDYVPHLYKDDSGRGLGLYSWWRGAWGLVWDDDYRFMAVCK